MAALRLLLQQTKENVAQKAKSAKQQRKCLSEIKQSMKKQENLITDKRNSTEMLYCGECQPLFSQEENRRDRYATMKL